MKKNVFLLCLLVSLLACKKVNDDCNQSLYPNAPESNWYFAYSGSEEEAHGHYILACNDGGFLQVGETGFIPNSAKLLVVKVDAQGQLEWKKEFGSKGHNLGNSAIETSDAYIITGALSEQSSIIKLDKSTGNTLWQKQHNLGGNAAYEQVVETDVGYMAIGYTAAEDRMNTFYTEGKGVLTLLDKQGNLQQQISLNNYMSHAYRIKAYQNSYYIAGLSLGAEDYVLVKIDSLGNVLLSKTYGGNNSDHCFAMDIDVSGNIYLSGHTLSGTENWDSYTMKIDPTGQLLWEQKRGNPRGFDAKYIHDEVWGLRTTKDGGCIVVAGTGDEYGVYSRKCGNDGDNSNRWHVYLLKYSAQGDLEWQKTYGDNNGGDWAGEDVCLTTDGGAVVAVDDGSFGFLKINSF